MQFYDNKKIGLEKVIRRKNKKIDEYNTNTNREKIKEELDERR